VPRLEQLAGLLAFTRDDVTVREGSVRVLGMPARFTLDRQPGTGVVVRGTGRAEMASLGRELDLPWMASLAGSTDWSATVKLDDDTYDLLVESNLRGVSSLLPPPLAKPAGSTLPFRLERRPRGREQDVLAFAVGKILSGQLAYNRSDPARVAQGELRLGGEAPAPERDGVWLAGRLDYFDWDRWHTQAVRCWRESASTTHHEFYYDLPAGPFRARLAAITDVRAMLPVLRVTSTRTRGTLIDRAAKTVAVANVYDDLRIAVLTGCPLTGSSTASSPASMSTPAAA